jgi:ACR3 family arsenite efflux pump ArsB
MSKRVGLEVTPGWWDFIRQVIIFALGIALIIDVAINPAGRVVLIITGLILIGLVPIDRMVSKWADKDYRANGDNKTAQGVD